MRTKVLAMRCFAEESAGHWEAHCVELGLAVRGETLEAVRRELDALIHRQIDDTVVRRRPTARSGAPLPRGPLTLRLRYWGLLLGGQLGLRSNGLRPNPRDRSPQAALRGLR